MSDAANAPKLTATQEQRLTAKQEQRLTVRQKRARRFCRGGDFFRHNLKRLRLEAGLSKHQLERLSGIDDTTISHLERCPTDPHFSTVVLLAHALKVPLIELARGFDLDDRGFTFSQGNPMKLKPRYLAPTLEPEVSGDSLAPRRPASESEAVDPGEEEVAGQGDD